MPASAKPPEEAQRLAALQCYEVLDTPPEPAFERLTALATRLFDVPIAMVTLVDADRQWFKSIRGLDVRQTHRDLAFCSHTILEDEVLVVPDATLDPRFADNPLVTGAPHIRFYAGAPLRTAEGHRVGTLSLVDTVPHPAGLDPAGRATLTDLAEIVIEAMELRSAMRRMREEEQERRKREEQIAALARQQSVAARFGQRALETTDVNLEGMLTEAADLVADTLGADFSTVFEHLPEHGVLVRRAGHGWPKEAFNKVETGSAASLETPSGYTLATGRPVISENIHQESRFKMSPYAQRQGVVAVADVIIARVADGSGPAPAPYGVLSALFRQARAFSSEEVAFLQDMANILGAAIARQRGEEALRKASEEAQRANAAKSEFLSRMSHELRTPMNAVLGFGQLLELEDLPEGQRESVNHILAGGRHLLSLIDEVLDVARIESDRLELLMEPVAVRGVVGEVLTLIKPLAANRAVTFEESIKDEGRTVMADRQRLKQVLLNLFSNAVKYNREGGRIFFECAPTDDDPSRVRLAVRDTGLGIAPELLPRLFAPYERLGAAKRGVEGTGIGLTISQRLVGAMGGTIHVSTVPGQGTAFTFDLLAATPTVPPREGSEGESPGVAQTPHFKPTVLHIEDHPPYQTLVRHVFEGRPDMQLFATMQGRMGVDLAREHRPDLILLDLELPDLHGEEVLRRLIAHPRTVAIPVIVLSAGATVEQIGRLLELGARQYLTKPVEASALLRAIDETLAGVAVTEAESP